MVGNDEIFNHQKMLKPIIGHMKIEELFNCLTKMEIVRLVVDDSVLYIHVSSYFTDKQKTVLRDLSKSGRYEDYAIDTYTLWDNMCRYDKNKTGLPFYDYVYDALGVKLRNA